MLSLAHAPTGALIATKIPHPLISIPLIILAHYLQDRVPHWDVGTGIDKRKAKSAAFFQELYLDFPASVLIVYFFFQAGQPQINWLAWMGWFFSLLPDFLSFPKVFLKRELASLAYLNKIHRYVHRSTPNIIQGILPQIIVIVLVYLLR